MNLRQLRFICEIIEHDLNISAAAATLHTSQPSVSRQIRGLEDELGLTIFRRSKRRIFGLTPAGIEIAKVARSISRQALDLKRIRQDFTAPGKGDLTIAASHTYARYILPAIIESFVKTHPAVRVVLRQGDPASIAQLVRIGEADLLISAKPFQQIPGVLFLPCRRVHRILLVPRQHAICRAKQLTLAALAKYPLITYDKSFEAHAQITDAFGKARLTPNIVLTASDVDVMKTYVKRGMGLAIVASIAYDSIEDRSLQAIDARHLFASNMVNIGIRKEGYIPACLHDFISLFAPKLTPAVIDRAMFESAQEIK